MTSLNLKSGTISAFILLALSAAVAQAGDWTGNVSAVLGQKTLDDKDWPQHDEHGSIGVMTDFKKKNWPLSIAVDFFGTGDEDDHGDSKHEGYTSDIHLGARKVFDLASSSFKPYIGAGLALVYAEETNNEGFVSRSDDDQSTGYWVGTGAYVQVSEHINVGADLRYSEAEVSLFNENREAGGVNFGVSAGYHW